jgi:hypothetical protein
MANRHLMLETAPSMSMSHNIYYVNLSQVLTISLQQASPPLHPKRRARLRGITSSKSQKLTLIGKRSLHLKLKEAR